MWKSASQLTQKKGVILMLKILFSDYGFQTLYQLENSLKKKSLRSGFFSDSIRYCSFTKLKQNVTEQVII